MAVYGVGFVFIGVQLLRGHLDTPLILLYRAFKWLLSDQEGDRAVMIRVYTIY